MKPSAATPECRIGYADPPYPGCAHLYRDHHDYGGEVDHRALLERLQRDYDGWVLHTHVPGLRFMERNGWLPAEGLRIGGWFKSFAAFKRNVSVAYAWEPVIIKAARKPVVSKRTIYRDFIETSCGAMEVQTDGLFFEFISTRAVPDLIKEPITLKRGLTGAKPEKVCHWAFELVGAHPEDRLDDIFPGTGAVTRAWESWRTVLEAA